jgi:hypothetical protein
MDQPSVCTDQRYTIRRTADSLCSVDVSVKKTSHPSFRHNCPCLYTLSDRHLHVGQTQNDAVAVSPGYISSPGGWTVVDPLIPGPEIFHSEPEIGVTAGLAGARAGSSLDVHHGGRWSPVHHSKRNFHLTRVGITSGCFSSANKAVSGSSGSSWLTASVACR